jgi:riboflavin biosynthesis pyrimidine reductase
MAMTLDGKVARPDGKWYGLSSRQDKRQMDRIRSQADALILGKNSLINDDPVIKLRYVEGKDPLPVILLRKGIVSKNRKVFSNPPVSHHRDSFGRTYLQTFYIMLFHVSIALARSNI